MAISLLSFPEFSHPDRPLDRDRVQMMREALVDAELACAYAADVGVVLDRDVFAAIAAYRHAFDFDPFDIEPEIETGFWHARGRLGRAIHPATPEALRDRLQRRRTWWRSLTIKAAGGFGVALAAMLLVTIQLHRDHTEIGTSLERAAHAASRFDNARDRLRLLTSASSGIGDAAAEKRELYRLCTGQTDWENEVEVLAQRYGLRVYDPSAVARFNERNRTEPTYLCLSDPRPEPTAAELKRVAEIELGSNEAFTVLKRAECLRAIQIAFILPLLYGLLGALASVVRSIANSLSNATQTPFAYLTYLLRLPLGALAGLAIGVLLAPETVAGVTVGVTLFGVAFAAGYAVEIVFQLIDRLIRDACAKIAGDSVKQHARKPALAREEQAGAMS